MPLMIIVFLIFSILFNIAQVSILLAQEEPKTSIWEASLTGDLDTVQAHIDAGTDLNNGQPQYLVTPANEEPRLPSRVRQQIVSRIREQETTREERIMVYLLL